MLFGVAALSESPSDEGSPADTAKGEGGYSLSSRCSCVYLIATADSSLAIVPQIWSRSRRSSKTFEGAELELTQIGFLFSNESNVCGIFVFVCITAPCCFITVTINASLGQGVQ